MVFKTKPDWGEWQHMKDIQAQDERFQMYWYNKFTMITSWDEPNWKDHWQVDSAMHSSVALHCNILRCHHSVNIYTT